MDLNTKYGIALAASTTDMMPWEEKHNLVLPYTKGWFACE
jgi:hypothetical protein